MRNVSFKGASAVLAMTLLLGWSATRSVADDAPAQGFGTVSGTVMDKDGKPAAGMSVNLWTPVPKKVKNTTDINDRTMKTGSKKNGKTPTPPVATGTTGTDGSFSIPNVAAGDYMVDAGTRKDPVAGYDHKSITVKDGQTTTVSLALKLPTTRKSS